MNRLECITGFIQVVEESSFVRAAKRLGISTAAMSRQISALEKYLGTQLLKRSTRQLTLTDVGMTYYQLCKTTLLNLVEAEHAISHHQKEAVGVLKVVSSRFLALSWIIPKLPTFLAKNPNLKVDLEIAERFPDFKEEGIDLLFGVSMEGPSELIRRRIMNTRYVLCASPSYLKAYGCPQSPNDLHQHIYIAHSMRTPVDKLSFKNGREIHLEPILKINDAESLSRCALQGMGIVKIQEYQIQEELKNGNLVELLKDHRTPTYPVFLYYPASKYMPAKIRCFIDFFALD